MELSPGEIIQHLFIKWPTSEHGARMLLLKMTHFNDYVINDSSQ